MDVSGDGLGCVAVAYFGFRVGSYNFARDLKCRHRISISFKSDGFQTLERDT